ncbi:iron-containing alcohol dehydrogenase [Halobellus ordinarius]|uniref:iron-containing alcohol dehydrogenase n=1 Tax=Halobellus ordinarius TaxID=3075120 RepID=UPI002880A5B9|nr:iron-containing alcohol dehydrogenase [Halobellus sp. ZY16]
MKNEHFEFVSDVPVSFGQNRAAELGSLVSQEGCSHPVIITDPALEEMSVIAPVCQALEESSIEYSIYTNVEPNPKAQDVDAGAERAVEEGWDGIVAVGGGSTIDTAKGIAIVATNAGSITDYQRKSGSYPTLSSDPLPLFAVPTTVGTGSEVTTGALVTDVDAGEKIVVGAQSFAPTRAVLDPCLLETLPPDIIASTGMDSFTQAVESYIALDANPFTEALALEAIRIISKNIRPAVSGTNLEALGDMQIATTLGGVAFNVSGLGLVHGISHQVSAMYDTPHGITNAVLLPHVLKFNQIAAPEKYARMAKVIGLPVADLTSRQAAARFLDEVDRLVADLGIPDGLNELGVEMEALPKIAGMVMETGSTNVREYSEDDVIEILESSF